MEEKLYSKQEIEKMLIDLHVSYSNQLKKIFHEFLAEVHPNHQTNSVIYALLTLCKKHIAKQSIMFEGKFLK